MRSTVKLVCSALIVGAILGSCLTFEVRPVPEATQRSVGARDASSVDVRSRDTVRLDAGTWEGTLRVAANNATVQGADVGRTIVRGTLIVNGNRNTISNLTVIGSVRIAGNSNDLTRVDLSNAEVTVRGNNNRQ